MSVGDDPATAGVEASAFAQGLDRIEVARRLVDFTSPAPLRWAHFIYSVLLAGYLPADWIDEVRVELDDDSVRRGGRAVVEHDWAARVGLVAVLGRDRTTDDLVADRDVLERVALASTSARSLVAEFVRAVGRGLDDLRDRADEGGLPALAYLLGRAPIVHRGRGQPPKLVHTGLYALGVIETALPTGARPRTEVAEQIAHALSGEVSKKSVVRRLTDMRGELDLPATWRTTALAAALSGLSRRWFSRGNGTASAFEEMISARHLPNVKG